VKSKQFTLNSVSTQKVLSGHDPMKELDSIGVCPQENKANLQARKVKVQGKVKLQWV